MAPQPTHPADHTPADPAQAIAIPPDRLREAVACLLRTSARVPREVIDRFIAQAPSLGIDTTLLAGVPDHPHKGFRQVCLPVVGPGRTVMLFLSTSQGGSPDDRTDRAAAVSKAVSLAAAAQEVHLVQALIEPHETRAGSAFQQAGLRQIAELLYLSRPLRLAEGDRTLLTPTALRHPDSPAWPAGVTVRPSADTPEDQQAIKLALEASYTDTLDCPELAGLRSTEDIIAAHRGVGQFDPALWWLVELADDTGRQPAGCVLLNRCADQGCVELVYIGLAPTLRGRGLGVPLLRAAVAVAASMETELRCAVDSRNTPARRIYDQLAFREIGRRLAFVAPVKDLPAHKS